MPLSANKRCGLLVSLRPRPPKFATSDANLVHPRATLRPSTQRIHTHVETALEQRYVTKSILTYHRQFLLWTDINRIHVPTHVRRGPNQC